jgi:hypothetical protein
MVLAKVQSVLGTVADDLNAQLVCGWTQISKLEVLAQPPLELLNLCLGLAC